MNAPCAPSVLRVAAAVLQRSEGAVLLAQRLPGTPFAGYWEFPGGKLEPGETAYQALVRELDEELGIRVLEASRWLTQRYRYSHADVHLSFFRVRRWQGEPYGRDGQALAWQTPGRFDVTPLLPANASVLRALELPDVYGITQAEDCGETAMLARIEHALDSGLRLIQVREKSFDAERLARFASAAQTLAAARGARVLLNGNEALARRLGLSGVHWSAAELLAARERPLDLLCGASCHDAAEIEAANYLAVDFVVLGPVRATPTHPGARALGWHSFEAIASAAAIPVFALGGLLPMDLDEAMRRGAHGVALRSGAWLGRAS